MRVLTSQEKKKRGCEYCADRRGNSRCKHDACPYHELDGYASYTDYLKANEGMEIAEIFHDL